MAVNLPGGPAGADYVPPALVSIFRRVRVGTSTNPLTKFFRATTLAPSGDQARTREQLTHLQQAFVEVLDSELTAAESAYQTAESAPQVWIFNPRRRGARAARITEANTHRTGLAAMKNRFLTEFAARTSWLQDPNLAHINATTFANTGQLREIDRIKRAAAETLSWLQEFNIESQGLADFIASLTQIETTTEQLLTSTVLHPQILTHIHRLRGRLSSEYTLEDFKWMINLKKVIDQHPITPALASLKKDLDRLVAAAIDSLTISNLVLRPILNKSRHSLDEIHTLLSFEKKIKLTQSLAALSLMNLSPSEINQLTLTLGAINLLKQGLARYFTPVVNPLFLAEETQTLTRLAAQTNFSAEDISKIFELKDLLSKIKTMAEGTTGVPASFLAKINSMQTAILAIFAKIPNQQNARTRMLHNVVQVAGAAQTGLAALRPLAEQNRPIVDAQQSAQTVFLLPNQNVVFKQSAPRAEEEESTMESLSHFLPGCEIVPSFTMGGTQLFTHAISLDQTAVQRGVSLYDVNNSAPFRSKLSTTDLEIFNQIDPNQFGQWEYKNAGDAGWTVVSAHSMLSLYQRGLIGSQTTLREFAGGHELRLANWKDYPGFYAWFVRPYHPNALWHYQLPGTTVWVPASFRRLQLMKLSGALPQDTLLYMDGGTTAEAAPLSTYMLKPVFSENINNRPQIQPNFYFTPDLTDPNVKQSYEICEQFKWLVGGNTVDFKELHRRVLANPALLNTITAASPTGRPIPADILTHANAALNCRWKLILPEVMRTVIRPSHKAAFDVFKTRQWRYRISASDPWQTIDFDTLQQRALANLTFLDRLYELKPVTPLPSMRLDIYEYHLNLGLIPTGTPTWQPIVKNVLNEIYVGNLAKMGRFQSKPFVRDMRSLFRAQSNPALALGIKNKLTPQSVLNAVSIGCLQPLDMHSNNIGLAPIPNAAYEQFRGSTFTVGPTQYNFGDFLEAYLSNQINDLTLVQVSGSATAVPLNTIPNLQDALNVRWKFVFFDTDISLSDSNYLQYQTGTVTIRHMGNIQRNVTGYTVPLQSSILELCMRDVVLTDECIAQYLSGQQRDDELDPDFMSMMRYGDAPVLQRFSDEVRTELQNALVPFIERYSLSSARRASGSGVTVNDLRNNFATNLGTDISDRERNDFWSALESNLLMTNKTIAITAETNTFEKLYNRFVKGQDRNEFLNDLTRLNPTVNFSGFLPLNTPIKIPQIQRTHSPEITIGTTNNTFELLINLYGQGQDVNGFYEKLKALNPFVDFKRLTPGLRLKIPLTSSGPEAAGYRVNMSKQFFPRITMGQIQALRDRRINSRAYLQNYQRLKALTPATGAALIAYIDHPTTPLNALKKTELLARINAPGITQADIDNIKQTLLQITQPNYLNMMCSMYPLLADTYELARLLYPLEPDKAGRYAAGCSYKPIEHMISQGQALRGTNPAIAQLADHLETQVNLHSGQAAFFRNLHGVTI